MPIALDAPHLAVSVPLEPHAPRAARFYVGQVDRPSPDLRNNVMLLTSELVTRAVQRREHSPGESVELRVWMPRDVVRVELSAARELLLPPLLPDAPRYDLMLLERLADRWAVEPDHQHPRMWFEIDRFDAHH
jgi:hypothetical protein